MRTSTTSKQRCARPLETVVASLAPIDIPPVALTAVALIAVVAIPALVVFYSERSEP